jgi:2-hydroxychromene-2-carboxylate isomerase
MPARIDFYFDFVSPYSYLASTALPRLAVEHAASISYRPFSLRDLMKIVGNRPTTIECKNKAIYAMADLQRWAKSYQVSFAPNPYWKNIDFAALGRGALVAVDAGRDADYVNATYCAIWGDPVDLSQRPVLMQVLDKAGFDGAHLLERAGSAELIAKLENNTRAAAERGVFGSPTMFVGTEMFFGNDRLDFVAVAVRAAA